MADYALAGTTYNTAVDLIDRTVSSLYQQAQTAEQMRLTALTAYNAGLGTAASKTAYAAAITNAVTAWREYYAFAAELVYLRETRELAFVSFTASTFLAAMVNVNARTQITSIINAVQVAAT